MTTLSELTSNNIRTLGIEQLTTLHRGVHRAARGGGDYDLLTSSHNLLAIELERKGVGHGTPLNLPRPTIHAIYLKSPHGILIAEGKKRAIAKPHPISGIEGKRIIVSKENGVGLAFGMATIGSPETVSADKFDECFEEHRVTSKERLRWWPDADNLILYPIFNFIPYDVPRQVEVPPGVQTLMTNIKFTQSTPDLLQLPPMPTIDVEHKQESITMPWKVFKRGNEWCVFKITEQDKPTGKTLGCHNSRPKAQSQVRALFASESKKMIEEVEQVISEVLDTPIVITPTPDITSTLGEQMKAAEPNQTTCTCPNCKEVSDHESGTPCNEIECANCGSMLRGGGDDREKAEDDDAPLDGRISAEVIQAIAEIVHAKMQSEAQSEAEVKTIAQTVAIPPIITEKVTVLTESVDEPEPDPRLIVKPENVEIKAGRRVRKDKLAKLKDLFAQLKDLIGWAAYDDIVPDLVLPVAKAFKGRDGRTWLMLWTTNSYIDRDDEIFRIKAIEDYVDRYQDNPIKGEFQFWHIPGTKFGNIVWQAIVADRFLVQMGTFDDTPIGNAFKAFLTSHPTTHPNIAPTGWGASHGYNYINSDRADGVYDWFNTVESSVLPMVYAANLHNPNPIVLGGKEMNDKQTAALRDIGEELNVDLVELVTKVGEQKRAEIDDFVEHKSKEGATVEADAETETPTTETQESTEPEPEVTKGVTDELQTSEEGTEDIDTAVTVEAIVTQVVKAFQLDSLSDTIQLLQTSQEAESAKVATLVTELTSRVAQLEQSDEKKVAERMDTMPGFSWFRASQAKSTILTSAESGGYP